MGGMDDSEIPASLMAKWDAVSGGAWCLVYPEKVTTPVRVGALRWPSHVDSAYDLAAGLVGKHPEAVTATGATLVAAVEALIDHFHRGRN
jgi:hypothetical protein